ncbi:MAG TPA: hypothetical protein VGD48_19570 [Kutzneria sp.]|jgi:hypothetical protein
MSEPDGRNEPISPDPPRPPGVPSVEDLDVDVPEVNRELPDEVGDEMPDDVADDVQEDAGAVEPPD